MRSPEHRTREGAPNPDQQADDEGLTTHLSEFERSASSLEIDYSAQAAVDPLGAFAVEPRAPGPERAPAPQRLVIPVRRNARPQRSMQALGLVALAAAAGIALAVLRSPDDAVATRPEAPLVQVENRTVVPAPVPRPQELDAPRAAAISGPTQSIPQTADVSRRLAKPARPLRVQAPAPRIEARRVAPPKIVPQPSIATAPVRRVAPDEESPRAPVSSPVAAVGREVTLSASPPVPVPTGGTTPEPSVGRIVEPPVPAAAAASPVAATPPPAAPRGAAQRAAVEAVLGQYANAFSALDARRAKAVWPNVNEKNLERAFDSLEQQEFNLGGCDITVLPPRALALCDGTARYTPRVGNRKERTESRRWTFNLRQTGQDWAIESVNLR